MLDVLQENIPLCLDVLDFIALHDGLLLENLDSVALPCGLLSAKIDLQGEGGSRNTILTTTRHTKK